MSIAEVIARLKMLGFKKHPHESTRYAYHLNTNKVQINITISIKRISINIIYTANLNKSVRTGHEQGLRFLAKFLYNLEQETN